MSGTVDKLKGKVKEAAGARTDDDKLRNEGKLDQAAGKVKDEKVKNAIEDRVDTIRHILERNGNGNG